MVNFENTQAAFQGRTDRELKKIYYLFKLVGKPGLVRLGKKLLHAALLLKLPLKWLLKPTIFRQFCGGETLEECLQTVKVLEKQGVKTYPAYSIEAKKGYENFSGILQETIDTIETAAREPGIPFTVFKPTAFIPVHILQKINARLPLSDDETTAQDDFHKRVDTLCRAAHENNVPILVDAEESYYQDAIDDITFEMMEAYNKEKAIVYNTVQMYRSSSLEFLKASLQQAENKDYYLGLKLVRGAYMEKERAHAEKHGKPSPIQPDKASTDKDFNHAIEFCAAHLDRIAMICASHNEKSANHMTTLMAKHHIQKNDPRVYFGQLFGMSDHMSFNLANAGYNVVKYVPYGPVKEVVPYLIRRAEENTSVAGQTGRQLQLILKEKQRRKNI
jgi:proline dehydrogenase